MTDSSATEVALDQEPSRAPRARSVAVAVALVAALGAAVFAGLSLADDGNTPEDAVRAMFEAVEDGDVLGVLEQLEPGERDAVRDPLTELVDELNRLDVLDGADLGDISGVDLTIEDVEYASERVADHVAAVRVTGGRAAYQLDPSELPIGGFLRDLLGDSLEEPPTSGEEPLTSSDGDEIVTTVRRGGRWYVSLGYTVAEAARRDAGIAFDELGGGITPDGAESPEAAVRALVQAGQEADVRRALELLPPGELSAVHDYAGLFLDDAEAAAAEARRTFEIDVPVLELESETSGNRATVFVRDLAFTATDGRGSIAFEDGCATVELPGEPVEESCAGDDPTAALEGAFGGGMFEDLLEGIEPPQLSFEDAMPEYGIATVRVDGKWYVSPTRSVLDNLVATIAQFEPRDLVELRRFFSEVAEAFVTSIEEAFAEPWAPEGAFDETCVDAAETYEEFQACFD